MMRICGVSIEKMGASGWYPMERIHPKQNEPSMVIILGLLEMVIVLNIILHHIMRCIREMLINITMVHTINLFIMLEDIIMVPKRGVDIILMLERVVLFMDQEEMNREVEH